MRIMLVALATLAVSVILPSSAQAIDYPWCVMGGELGYSGDCSYQTRAQCLASASGRWNTYCDMNPRVLFEQRDLERRRGQPDPTRPVPR